MRICVTLDDVIRAKTAQFGKIYKKAYDSEDKINFDELEVSTDDLSKVFNMTTKEYNKFLYEDYPFEIFAEAPVMEKMLDKMLNLWLLEHNEDVEVIIANAREFNTSLGYTCFFLSQIATRVREFYFPTDSTTIWDKCDVVITATPSILNSAPINSDKKAVKITTSYNKDCPADFVYDSLAEILNDKDFLNKISNG